MELQPSEKDVSKDADDIVPGPVLPPNSVVRTYSWEGVPVLLNEEAAQRAIEFLGEPRPRQRRA